MRAFKTPEQGCHRIARPSRRVTRRCLRQPPRARPRSWHIPRREPGVRRRRRPSRESWFFLRRSYQDCAGRARESGLGARTLLCSCPAGPCLRGTRCCTFAPGRCFRRRMSSVRAPARETRGDDSVFVRHPRHAEGRLVPILFLLWATAPLAQRRGRSDGSPGVPPWLRHSRQESMAPGSSRRLRYQWPERRRSDPGRNRPARRPSASNPP